jgi:phage terminase large subunit
VERKQLRIVPDASGAARSTTGKSDHQILRDAGFRVKAPKKNPFVKDRINCVNGLLAPQEGSVQLMVDPSCKHSIETLENHLYKEDSDPPEPDKESGLDHMADAIGYPCWAKFPLRLVTMIPRGNGGGPSGFNGSQRRAA